MATQKTLSFNPNDFDSLKRLMDKHGDLPYKLFGMDAEGNAAFMSISHESIIIETYQANGWTRINTYYYDGTREETYTK